MKKTLILLLALMVSLVASAQTISDKKGYTLEKMYWMAPSVTFSNPAFLLQTAAALDSVKALTDASLFADYDKGTLKNCFDPESNFVKGLNVKSYSILDKVALYGRFGYEHNNLTNSQWRGLYDPYETPFMMTDSIPGNATIEMYRMEMGIAVPLGEHWSVGTSIRYYSGVMAKHKDLRNKNTLMDFDIRPGIAFEAKNVQAGLDIGYTRSTEKIEYMQVDASTEKYLFDVYGLWVFNSQGYSSAETSRLKETQAYNAGAQLTLRLGELAFHNRFEIQYSLNEQEETGYNNLRHGDVKQLTYNYNGVITYGLQHRLTGYYKKSDMLGYRYLQQQELDVASSVRRWVTYDIMNTYKSSRTEWEAAYTFRKARSAWDVSWEATAGVKSTDFGRETVEYPQRFTQSIDYKEAYLLFTKHVAIGKRGILALTPSAAYRKGQGNPMEIVLDYTSQNISTGEGQWMLTEQLMQEYNWWTSPQIQAGLRIRYAHSMSGGGVSLYAEAGYRGAFSAEGSGNADGSANVRHMMQLSVGMTF